MSCRLDVKKAIYKSIRETLEFDEKILPRNTYEFVKDGVIRINSKSDNSDSKINSKKNPRVQAKQIGEDLARKITKVLGDKYKKNIYFSIDSSDQFKPVYVSMTINPAYVEHEYRKLPESQQTDPLDFNTIGINSKRNTTDYFIVPKYFSDGNITTSKAILEKIAASSHPLAPVAKALIPFDTNSTVELVAMSNVNGGAGVYNRITHKIEIAKFAGFRGLGVEPTLIHEILHAITVNYIERNSDSKEVKDLFNLFAHSRKYKNEMEDDYSFTNIKEFIVAIFTDAEFVKTLSTKPPFEKVEKYNNAFEEILDYILNLFKFKKPEKSLYKQAFEIATHIIKNGKEEYDSSQTNDTIPDEAFFNGKESPLLFNLAAAQQSPEISYQTPAQQETIQKIKEALAAMGATIETSNSVLEEFGANAVIDLADKLIRIAEGKEQVALTEEAMHLLTALLPKQMFDELMKEVKNYKMYKLTFDQYSKHPAYQNEDGSPNEEKIKFEAVGKILAEYYIMHAEGLSKKEVALAKTLWGNILDWIKRMFGNKSNKFYKIIDGLNRGTLQLEHSPSRRDRMLQILFTRANAENLTEALSIKGPSIAVNKRAERAINGIIELTKNIESSDIKVVNEAMSHVRANNSTFKTSNAKLERFKNVTELKDKVLQSLEYIRSLGNNIDTLSARSKELRTLLEEKKNEDGVDLTETELKFASIELSNINTIASIYIDELKNYVDLFHERTETFGLTDALSAAKSQAERIIALNDAIGEEYLEAALDKFLEEKRKGFIRERNRELLHYNNRLKNSPSPKEKKFIEEKIKIIEDRIANHGISGAEMIKMMKSKKTSVLGVISHYMEPSLMHKDEAIQTIANLVLDAAKEAYDAAHATMDEYDRIFEKLGAKPTDISKFYDKFVEVVDRKEFDDKNGKLKEWKETRLISEYNQHEFENDIAQLKYEIFLAQEEEDKNLEKQKIDELSTLYKESGVRRYTDKYYELTDVLDTPLENPTDTIKTVRDARNVVIEELNLANEELDDAVDVVNKINAHIKVDEALRKLQTLSSIYNVDGSLKKGDAKIIADTLALFKENKREHELDNWFLSHTRSAQWEEERDDIDRRYSKALLDDDYDEIEKLELEKEVWYSINTVQSILPEYYERREDTSTKIADILEKSKDAEDQERLDDLYYELSELTKGYKDSDRTIIGEDFNKSQVQKIKEVESEMRRIREKANESSQKLKREDKRLLRKLFKELDELQSTVLTKSWNTVFEREKTKLVMRLPKGHSQQDFNEALQNSAFIKENTFEVTEKYRHTVKGLPESVVRIGNKVYAPIYIWRKVMPKEEWIDDVTPSLRWMTYSVNKDFVNKDQKNLMGKVKIDPSKEQPNKYINQKYKDLKKNPKDVEFIEALRERYYKDQMLKATYERRGDALPTIQADGLQRLLGRFRNLSGVDWKGMKSWAYWKDKFYNLLGLDATTLETVFGEGDIIEPYTVDKGFIQSRNKFKVQVKNKFAQKDFNVNRQDKDLFKVLTMYAVEANRSAKMKEIAPLLSTVKRISPVEARKNIRGNTVVHKRTARMNYEIERQVNRQTKLDEGLGRIAASVSGFATSSIAFQRIGLPHMISSSVKNSMNGAWQLFNSKGYLTEYSEESLMKAYFNAIPKAFKLTAYNFKKDPGLYFAVARRMNAISSINIHDRIGLQKSTALLVADNLKYIAGSQRRMSEIHQELVLFELLRGNKIPTKDKDGNHIEVDILDMYTYNKGELTPKEGMTPEIENSFRNKINEMHTMAQGNFNPENAIYLKAFWWGRVLSFMKGFVYNPFIRRFGGTRRFITGVEQRGMYRIMYDILSTHPKDIFKPSNLTNNEKAGLYGFLKDFFLVNAIGLLTYWAEAMASEGDDGGDDDDKWFNWYVIMMLRKFYGEIGYFNFLDMGVTAKNLLFDDDSKAYSRGNQIDNFITYAVERPGGDMIKSAIIPFDVRGLKFDRDIEGKVPDPFYSQYDDNVLLYDFMRTIRAKPEVFYGKSALSTYQYYNQSMFNYEKPKEDDKQE